MNIHTRHEPPPIPQRDHDWYAIDADTYDGAPDAGCCRAMGFGATEAEAIEELLQAFENGPAWQRHRARLYRYAAAAHAEVARRGITGPLTERDRDVYRECWVVGMTATEAGAQRATALIRSDR